MMAHGYGDIDYNNRRLSIKKNMNRIYLYRNLRTHMCIFILMCVFMFNVYLYCLN